MKLTKSQLREMIKPMVKEIVQDMMLNQLSTVIAEVVKGLNQTVIVEQKKRPAITQTVSTTAEPSTIQSAGPDPLTERMNKLKSERKAMLDRIGKSSVGGVNIFEGTTPTLEESAEGDPMSGQDPNDPGVNINGLMGVVGSKWKNNLVS